MLFQLKPFPKFQIKRKRKYLSRPTSEENKCFRRVQMKKNKIQLQPYHFEQRKMPFHQSMNNKRAEKKGKKITLKMKWKNEN